MERYYKTFIRFVVGFVLGFAIMLMSSELLASPDDTVYWLGVLVTLSIALTSGLYIAYTLKRWFLWAIEKIKEDEEPI